LFGSYRFLAVENAFEETGYSFVTFNACAFDKLVDLFLAWLVVHLLNPSVCGFLPHRKPSPFIALLE